MKYRLLTLAVLGAVTASCANHDVRDRLDIQDPTVSQTTLAPQSTLAGGLTRNELKDKAAAEWRPADPNSPDPWMQQYGGNMYNRKQGLDQLQQRLTNVGQNADNYYGAKAQCWIDAGRAEQGSQNGWGFVEEAMGQANRLTGGLEANNPPLSTDNPPLRTSSTLRPDLWAQIERYKADPRMANCIPAQKRVACQEVQLMYAGHDAWRRSFDEAQTKVDAIQPQLSQVNQDFQNCEPKQQLTPPPPPPPPAVVLPPVITLGADALFKFDRGDLANMLPAGKEKLDNLAATLPKVKGVRSLEITGHTDRFGTDAHNAALSQQRADTVMSYLRSKGVTVPMSAKGVASVYPLVQCPGPHVQKTFDCLQPNRRVEIRVVQ